MHRRRFLQLSVAAALAANIQARHAYAAILGAANTVSADVNAITGDGAEVTLKQSAVQELGDSLRGNLLLPGHEAYEEARLVLNPSIDKHPALIVQPKGAADVRNAVDFARESSLPVAVKCGGHSSSGKSTCDGGMMIDLSLLRSTRVDPTRRIAQVSGGSWLGDMDHDTMAFGLNFYAEYSATAPDELYIDAGVVSRPETFTGAFLHVCYSGDPAQADKYLDPIRKAGTPMFDEIKAVDYVALQKSGDISDPRARGAYLKSGFVEGISPALIDTLLEGFEPNPERGMAVVWQHAGGAIGRVAPDAMAFAHRGISHDTLFIMDWPMGIDATPHIEWLRSYFATVAPYTRGFYTNDLSDEFQAAVNKNYAGNYERLVQIKNQYDPTNLFRLNANVVPTV
jgi:hypothetical protein